MKLAFRVDAATEMGLGHVMRCMTLADAAQTQGAHSHFLSAKIPDHLAERLLAKGHALTVLPTCSDPEAPENPRLAHHHWINGSQRQDAAACLAALLDQAVDWVVLDHYGLSQPWQIQMRATGAKMAVIDDIADRVFDADLLVDPNPLRAQVNPYSELMSDAAALCLGGDFAILRPEFAAKRAESITYRERSDSGNLRLLVMFGGTDPQNATGRSLDALKELPSVLARIAQVDIVLGHGSLHLGAVAQSANELSIPTQLHVDLRDVAGLMARSDLCIGAAGGVAWERCCLGLPSLLFQIADNQAKILSYLETAGAGMGLRDLQPSTLKQAFDAIGDAELQRMCQIALGLVDGLGSDRIIARMLRDQHP